jgi:pimeloyl-ACP methyl ester carboxylesterase
MVDDAAQVRRALEVPSAHVAGFSGGSIIAQELALRHAEEGFFLWIYTARAHNDGTVAQIIEEVLAFPRKQATEDMQRFLDAFFNHDTIDRLPQIAAPTLVLAGGRDMTSRPELCRAVAELIPGARFEVMEEEVPDQWNVISISWHRGGVQQPPLATPRRAGDR